jgi:tRNA-Thr(GGU) m(6)t(6)A37 methyltransferase TsaA
VQTSYGLAPIAWVQSALKVLDDAPNQRDGAPRAWIRFDEQVAEGVKDLRPGDEIMVLTWLHLSPRDELSTHPEDDMSQPLTGVFSTCSPNRPNPIGLHRARITARDGLRIEVDALEAIDGTPVVDVKPAIDLFGARTVHRGQSRLRMEWTTSRPLHAHLAGVILEVTHERRRYAEAVNLCGDRRRSAGRLCGAAAG